METFCESFLAGVPDSDRKALIAEIEDSARAKLQDADGKWRADYIRLRFSALKPGG